MQITDAMIRSICSDTIYQRGLEYFSQGRVHLRRRDEKQLTAVIDGERLYTVQILFHENKIGDCFCTCQYHRTMQCTCKHIVAALKQYQTESENGSAYTDSNDTLAALLCTRFSQAHLPKTRLNAAFSLHIFTKKECRYELSIRIGSQQPSTISDADGFLAAYGAGESFLLSKQETYSPMTHDFSDVTAKILNILAESRQNKTIIGFSSPNTSFGAYTAKRLLPLLSETGFDLLIDGVKYTDFRIKNENPDILVDIDAMDAGIILSVTDAGFAFIPDGSWFLYEGDLYHTDPDWRGWYMPIYRTLTQDMRTQLHFKGNNTVLFASQVLPQIRSRHGVSVRGVSNLVVETEPKFEVYFDKYKTGISAVIKAFYGSIAVRLPNDVADTKKIIIRSTEMENTILVCFSSFSCEDNLYTLLDNEAIFDFLSQTLPRLQKLAKLYYSDAFKTMHITSSTDVSVYANYNKNTNLLDVGFQTSLSAEEIRGILSAVQLRRRFYRLTDGRFLALDRESDTMSVLDLLNKLNFQSDDLEQKSKSLNRRNALYLDAAARRGLIKTNHDFNSLIQHIKNIKPHIPPHLASVLRPYQTEGVTWLTQLSAFECGGILADDMGLGKTLQVIAFICGMKLSEPTLVVTPSALTYNWKNEIERFAPEKTVLIIDGGKKERSDKLKQIDQYDFIITSYPLLRRDIALYDKLSFDYFFIDEAQYIKNPSTMNAHAVKRINAVHHFALTGTPIENSLTELWSIFDFVMKGYLYSHQDFYDRYESHIGHPEEKEAIAALRDKIAPFILRRMKTEVLAELPEKIENTMFAELTKEQKNLYASYLALAKDEAVTIMTDENTPNGRMKILSLLMRLRQICCHPTLFDASYTKDSGKLILLEELVSNGIVSGHSILIFSQFTSMLKIIREHLTSKGYPTFYLDGSTPPDERTMLAERFNNGEAPIFLISLKAGGTGLNLTGADMVIHYDPWWNPSVMDQASDRAHRIGQKRAVQVIKLASRGTIEEKIIRLQDKKRRLADGVIRANKAMLGKLTKDEILALFD